jgi:uroporphyrinogen-III decarboxylase
MQELPAMAPYITLLGTPEMQKALQSLMDAGKKAFEWGAHIADFEKWARENGHVNGLGGFSKAPFDVLGDTIRGTRPIMMDMFRRPDLIVKACERLAPIMIKNGLYGVEASNNPVVFMPLHKGADGFMSDEHFRTIYWPTLKQVISGLIEEGCVPLLFAEGGYETRLEYINELPKGHCIWMFDRTDMARAKEVVGGNTCIMGNVPVTTILSGTPEKIRSACKDLIDVAGKNGGYIMTSGCAMDEARPDTLHAMIDFTKEYGIY